MPTTDADAGLASEASARPATTNASDSRPAEFDQLESADFFTDTALVSDPYQYFDALRARCPVHPVAHPGVVAVTGYDEAVEVYKDGATYSSCNSVGGPYPPAGDPA